VTYGDEGNSDTLGERSWINESFELDTSKLEEKSYTSCDGLFTGKGTTYIYAALFCGCFAFKQVSRMCVSCLRLYDLSERSLTPSLRNGPDDLRRNGPGIGVSHSFVSLT